MAHHVQLQTNTRSRHFGSIAFEWVLPTGLPLQTLLYSFLAAAIALGVVTLAPAPNVERMVASGVPVPSVLISKASLVEPVAEPVTAELTGPAAGRTGIPVTRSGSTTFPNGLSMITNTVVWPGGAYQGDYTVTWGGPGMLIAHDIEFTINNGLPGSVGGTSWGGSSIPGGQCYISGSARGCWDEGINPGGVTHYTVSGSTSSPTVEWQGSFNMNDGSGPTPWSTFHQVDTVPTAGDLSIGSGLGVLTLTADVFGSSSWPITNTGSTPGGFFLTGDVTGTVHLTGSIDGDSGACSTGTAGPVTSFTCSGTAPADGSSTFVIEYDKPGPGTIPWFLSVEATGDDSDPNNNTVSGSSEVIAVTELVVDKVGPGDPVMQGSTFTYTLGVSNNGPSIARGVWVTDTLPANVLFKVDSPALGDARITGDQLGWNLGDLTATSTISHSLVYSGTYEPTLLEPTTIQNTAVLTSPAVLDPDGSNNTETVVTRIIPEEGDVGLYAQSTVVTVTADIPQRLSYTFTNTATTSAAIILNGAVTTTATTDPTFLLGGSADPCEVSTTRPRTNLQCSGTVPAGGSLQFDVNLDRYTPGDDVEWMFFATVTGADTNSNNNLLSGTTRIDAVTDLAIDMSGPAGPIMQGLPLTYTLSIQNNGPSISRGTVFTNTFPANMGPLGNECPVGGTLYHISERTVCTWGLGALNADEVVSLEYAATYNTTVVAPINVLNEAVISSDSRVDPVSSNNMDGVQTEIVALSLSGTGRVFVDANADSFFDVFVEIGLEGGTIVVDSNNNGSQDPGEQSTVSGADGLFELNSLIPGLHDILVLPPAPFVTPTEIIELDLTSGEWQFLLVPVYEYGGIEGIKFRDDDGDGVWDDPGEPLLAGWTITCSGPSCPAGTTTVTDANGHYLFSNLIPGEYIIGEVLKSGWTQVYPTPAAPTNGKHTVTVASGQIVEGKNFGNILTPGGVIIGRKFFDIGQDQVDDGDPGINDVLIDLELDGVMVRQTTTANVDLNSDGIIDRATETGVFRFLNVPPGSYVLSEVVPGGMFRTFPADPGTHDVDVLAGIVNPFIFRFGNFANLIDWGDLPDPRMDITGGCPLAGMPAPKPLSCYPTLAKNRGAAHVIRDFWMGDVVDAEPDGQPNPTADGDDLSPPVPDDEDGLTGPPSILTDGSIRFELKVTNPNAVAAHVDIWIDLDDNGLLTEQVIDDFPTPASGIYTILTDPATTTLDPGDTIGYMRLRISTQVGLTPEDLALDGEVEDYWFVGMDFGDAHQNEHPDYPEFPFGYPTTLASDGARHVAVDQVRLGDRLDPDPDGVPSILADGDDETTQDDEDGVVFDDGFVPLMLSLPTAPNASTSVPGMIPNTEITFIFLPSTTGILDAWIDWNRDGDWSDAGELVFGGLGIAPLADTTKTTVPATAAPGLTYARFRFSRNGSNSFTGPAPDGEVEDYLMMILPEISVGSSEDTGDANPGDGICDDGNGLCTLRAAIEEANASGPIVFRFAVSGKNKLTITPQSPLPAFEVPIIVDGGGEVTIDGSQAGAGANGLTIQAGGSRVLGLTIQNFDGHGVLVESGDGTQVLGSTLTGNNGDGIRIVDGVGVRLDGNSIFDNGGLGIDLGGNGVTSNDADDLDIGPNGLLNYPVITLATAENGHVDGTLTSLPESTFSLEFFVNAACDASGNGEGQTSIGHLSVTTDITGNALVSFDSGAPFVAGHGVAATSTDSNGSTSEFSNCVQAIFTGTEDGTVPTEHSLYQNYPNPFNPLTTIQYVVSQTELVTIEVFDIIGQRVVTLVDGVVAPGIHAVTFDAGNLPSGIYLYRMRAGSYEDVKKLTLLK